METVNTTIDEYFSRVVIDCEPNHTPQEKKLLLEYIQNPPASIQEKILYGVLIQEWDDASDSLDPFEESYSILSGTLKEATEPHHRFWIHFHQHQSIHLPQQATHQTRMFGRKSFDQLIYLPIVRRDFDIKDSQESKPIILHQFLLHWLMNLH